MFITVRLQTYGLYHNSAIQNSLLVTFHFLDKDVLKNYTVPQNLGHQI